MRKHGVSKDGRRGTALPAAVLRDARKSALLRTRLIDDIHMIRISETVYWRILRLLCGRRPRPHPAAVHEVDRRIENHLVSRLHAVAHLDLRAEIPRDRYLLDAGDPVLDDGHLQAVAVEDDGIRRDQQRG